MNEKLQDFLLYIVAPTWAFLFVVNLMYVSIERKPNQDNVCKMETLLDYFPTHWISCELTRPRFKGENK